MDIKDIMDRYDLDSRARGYSEKTISHVKASVRYFSQYLGDIEDVNIVTGDDFRRFLVALRERNTWEGLSFAEERKLSATTINTDSRGIKSFWNWLKQKGIIAENPLESVPNPKKSRTIPKVYSEDELRAVFQVLPERSCERAIIETMLDSGIRLSELASLELSDIDLESGRITVYGKGGKERYTYISPVAIKTISDYYNKSRPKPVRQEKLFLSKGGHPLSSGRIQKILAEIGRKADISERLAPHKLRHTCATLLLKYGNNLEHIRMILGHSDIKTTSEAYLNVADQEVAAAHRKSSPLENILERKVSDTEKSDEDSSNGHSNTHFSDSTDTVVTTDRILEAKAEVSLQPSSLDSMGSAISTSACAYFIGDLEKNDILIISMHVHSSDPRIPYQVMLFYGDPPEDTMDWEYEDIIRMKPVRQRIFSYSPTNPLPYTVYGKNRQLHGGIVIGERPLRFDISYDDDKKKWVDYYQAVVHFTVTLRYKMRLV